MLIKGWNGAGKGLASCGNPKTGVIPTQGISYAQKTNDAKLTPFYRLGWAFLLAWVFCVFYLDAINGFAEGGANRALVVSANPTLPLVLYYACLPVAMSVLMLVLIVGLERRLGSPCDHAPLFIVAPVTTALSTPMLYVVLENPVASALVFGVASWLTGVGSGFLWVMWGQYYTRLSLEDVESSALASALLAALITLVMTAMSGWVALVLVSLFPVISGWCLWRSWRDVAGVEAPDSPKRSEPAKRLESAGRREHAKPAGRSEFALRPESAERSEAKRARIPVAASFAGAVCEGPDAPPPLRTVLPAMGRSGFGLCSACLFVCFVGGIWDVSSQSPWAVWGSQLALGVSLVFMLVVGLTAVRGPRRVSLTFLYRWMCPALVVGLAALIACGQPAGAFVGFLVSVAARFAFCLITLMYFARYAMSGQASAVQSYGLGWIFVHLGDLLGAVALVVTADVLAARPELLASICAVATALYVTSVMFVLNDKASFAYLPASPHLHPGEGVGFRAATQAPEAPAGEGCTPGGSAGTPAAELQEDASGGVEGSAGISAVDALTGTAAEGEPSRTFGEAGDVRPSTASAPTSSAASSVMPSPSAPTASGAASGSVSVAASIPEVQAVNDLDARIASLAKEYHLTPRETEVFDLLARGRSIPYVRDALVISRETASTHAKHIYAKLGIHSRQELIDLVH